jgi:hypothetical protein
MTDRQILQEMAYVVDNTDTEDPEQMAMAWWQIDGFIDFWKDQQEHWAKLDDGAKYNIKP